MNGHSDAIDNYIEHCLADDEAYAEERQEYYNAKLRNEAFLRHLDGKTTVREWSRIDDKLNERKNTATSPMASRVSTALVGKSN